MMSSGSVTSILEFKGHHYWKIHNWKGWVGCSEKDATIYSEKFSVPIINDDGKVENTQWMVKAFPKKHSTTGKDMLAFRLVSLNSKTPKGSFYFKTVAKNFLGREHIISKFKPLPLDAAYHWMTCIRYHTSDNLTIKVKLRIVSCGDEPGNRCRDVMMLDSATKGRFWPRLSYLASTGGFLFPPLRLL